MKINPRRARLVLWLIPLACTGAALADPPRPGEIVSWGERAWTNLPEGPFVAISAGPEVLMALRPDGSAEIVAPFSPGPLAGPFTDIAGAGWELDWSAFGLLTDGSLVRWGFMPGNPPPPPPTGPFVDVIGSGWACIARRADGTLASWGQVLCGTCAGLPAGSILMVDGGMWEALAVRADGSLVAWGLNNGGLPAPPAGTFKAASIAYSMGNYAAAIRSDGTLVAWGNPASAPPAPPAGQFKAIEIGDELGMPSPPWGVAIRPDGTLASWGASPTAQVTPPSGKFVAITTGIGRAFALAGCYADCNEDGQLTVADFGCYQTAFVMGGPYADCNGDGQPTVADFGCFQTQFVQGCP